MYWNLHESSRRWTLIKMFISFVFTSPLTPPHVPFDIQRFRVLPILSFRRLPSHPVSPLAVCFWLYVCCYQITLGTSLPLLIPPPLDYTHVGWTKRTSTSIFTMPKFYNYDFIKIQKLTYNLYVNLLVLIIYTPAIGTSIQLDIPANKHLPKIS